MKSALPTSPRFIAVEYDLCGPVLLFVWRKLSGGKSDGWMVTLTHLYLTREPRFPRVKSLTQAFIGYNVEGFVVSRSTFGSDCLLIRKSKRSSITYKALPFSLAKLSSTCLDGILFALGPVATSVKVPVKPDRCCIGGVSFTGRLFRARLRHTYRGVCFHRNEDVADSYGSIC